MGYKVLGFDSSGGVTTAGLVEDGRLLADISFRGERIAGSHLVEWIDHIVALQGPPDGIGVGIGPGSFTGVRVSISAAKALAYAWAVPVKGVSSLAAWALALPAGSRVVVTSERRGPAFYLALYYVGADHVVPIVPDTAISGALPAPFPLADAVWVVGPAAEDPALMRAIGPQARPHDAEISGLNVARLAWPGLQWGQTDDVSLLQPSYLRPPAISRPAR